MNHFTDQQGFKAIKSQSTWTFKAKQPRADHHPAGAYFTDYLSTEPNLAKRIRVSRSKLEFAFSFNPPHPLKVLPGGRGRLARIFYSPEDYQVAPKFQTYAGETGIK